jgi:hypothetical protein
MAVGATVTRAGISGVAGRSEASIVSMTRMVSVGAADALC